MTSLARVPLALLAVGVLALLGGAYMVASVWHHTMGLGVIGVGVLLVVVGAGLSLSGKVWSKAGIARTEGASSGGVQQRKIIRLMVVAVVIAIVAVAGVAYVVYVAGLVKGSSQPTLSLHVESSTEVAYPNGTVAVHLSVGAAGGTPPYSFSAQWQDSTIQTSPVGNFTRAFRPGETIDSAVYITAKSAGRALGYLYLTLPAQTLPLFAGGGPVAVVTESGIASSSSSSNGGNNTSSTTTTFSAATQTLTSVSIGSISVRTGLPPVVTPQPNSFTITVQVVGPTHQPIAGATVTFDGGNSQTTGAGGEVTYQGVAPGSHSVTVVSGSFDQSFPLVLPSGSTYTAQTMFVVVS